MLNTLKSGGDVERIQILISFFCRFIYCGSMHEVRISNYFRCIIMYLNYVNYDEFIYVLMFWGTPPHMRRGTCMYRTVRMQERTCEERLKLR